MKALLEVERQWKWYTYALLAFANLQLFSREPHYIHVVLLSSIAAMYWLTHGVARGFVLVPLALEFLTAFYERKATGWIRRLIFKFVCFFPPCDARKDPLLVKAIKPTNVPLRQKRRILVTGGTGFCGVQVVKFLTENYPDWKIALVSRSASRMATVNRIQQVCREHGIPFFNTDEIEVIRGDFKKLNLGRTFEELDAVWNDIGVVFHFAMCNSYFVPYECNYKWNQNLDVICRLCQKHGVQLHAMGGSGYHILEDCEIPVSNRRGSTWCNGYFQFKQFQRLLVEKYIEHGLHACTYDVAYIFADVEPKSARSPSDYEAGFVVKFIRHFGAPVGFVGEVVTPRAIAAIIAKHTDIAFKRGALESKYMHLFVQVFNDLNHVVCGRKERAQVEETIRNTTVNSDALITAYRDLFPDFMVGRKIRPLECPIWAKEILDTVDGQEVARKFVQQCDDEGMSFATFKNPSPPKSM